MKVIFTSLDGGANPPTSTKAVEPKSESTRYVRATLSRGTFCCFDGRANRFDSGVEDCWTLRFGVAPVIDT
jgi:hypothetical protein